MQTLCRSNLTPDDLVPELRDLFGEYPFLAHRESEAVCRALRVFRCLASDVFTVEAAMEALMLEDFGVCA